MKQWNTRSLGINSVSCVKGEFSKPALHGQGEPMVTLTMVYCNSETFQTFGTCPASNAVFSQQTMDALREFLQLAENDFAKVVAGKNVPEDAAPASTGRALGPLGGD
jgi:hypothetical protein